MQGEINQKIWLVSLWPYTLSLPSDWSVHAHTPSLQSDWSAPTFTHPLSPLIGQPLLLHTLPPLWLVSPCSYTPSLPSDWSIGMSPCFCLNEPITMVKFNGKSKQQHTHTPTDNRTPKPALRAGKNSYVFHQFILIVWRNTGLMKHKLKI